MILVSGAAGKTGQAIIGALTEQGKAVRALVRKESQSVAQLEKGATEVVLGDMGDYQSYERAMVGVSAVYLICPNVNPNEIQFVELAIEAALAVGKPHFVYHSVLHPQVKAMPHHWLKMRVEEHLFASGLPFTILQPTAYMQNFLASWPTVLEKGVFRVPYSAETRLCLVDLGDVAKVAAEVLGNAAHHGAIYELVGTVPLSQIEVADIVGRKLKRPIRVEQIPIPEWEKQAVANGLGRYQIDTLINMFNYYDQYGFIGNRNVLSWLLNRPPTTFDAFIDRIIEYELK